MLFRIAFPFANALTALCGCGDLGVSGKPANDNGFVGLQDPLLRAALRHFGTYGLGAARDAERRSQAALRSGEEEASRRWLEIRRLLGGGPRRPQDLRPSPAR